MSPPRCFYADVAGLVGRMLRLSGACSQGPWYIVRGYWRGRAIEEYGPDLRLCPAHALWWNGSSGAALGLAVKEDAREQEVT